MLCDKCSCCKYSLAFLSFSRIERTVLSNETSPVYNIKIRNAYAY